MWLGHIEIFHKKTWGKYYVCVLQLVENLDNIIAS